MEAINNSDMLKQIDIRTVLPETLKDIRDVNINTDIPVQERILEFIKQIQNPYCFRCGKLIVQVEYKNTDRTVNDCLKEYFESQLK